MNGMVSALNIRNELVFFVGSKTRLQPEGCGSGFSLSMTVVLFVIIFVFKNYQLLAGGFFLPQALDYEV